MFSSRFRHQFVTLRRLHAAGLRVVDYAARADAARGDTSNSRRLSFIANSISRCIESLQAA